MTSQQMRAPADWGLDADRPNRRADNRCPFKRFRKQQGILHRFPVSARAAKTGDNHHSGATAPPNVHRSECLLTQTVRRAS